MTLQDIRCPDCRRLLMRANIILGVSEIKCKCGKLTTFTFGTNKPAPPRADWHSESVAELTEDRQ